MRFNRRMARYTILFVTIICAVVVANELESNVDDFIGKINSQQNSWKAAHNPITNRGLSYMKRLLGTKISNVTSELPVVSEINNNIPDSFDARKEWPKCASIKSIKNQGRCGSCWAVAMAGAASDRLCIQSKFKTRVNISAENLMSCCSTCVYPGTGGCDGGYPVKAWEYFKNTGLVTGGDYGSNEGCQPYEISSNMNHYTPPCSENCTNTNYKTPYIEDKHYGKTVYRLAQSESAIQTDIMENGSVEAAFIVYLDFIFYKSGIYEHTTSIPLGGHGVRVIGWGVENGAKYWLVANSWGTRWGENGLFRIRRGTDECRFESFVTAGLIKK